MEKYGLSIENQIWDNDRFVYIFEDNFTPKSVQISEGEIIGEITEEIPNDPMLYFIEKATSNVEDITKDDTTAFNILSGSELEKERMENFLIENKDLFVSNVKDLTLEKRVKHSIKTGEHKPIFFPPYRTSVKFKDEIKKQVNEIWEIT